MAENIKGLRELIKKFEDLKDIDAPKALLKGAYTLQRFSMENAPVKTGFLRQSHESVETHNGAEMRVNANYSFFVEYGTAKMKAIPFVRPAIDNHESDILKAIEDDIQKQIGGLAK